MRRLGLLVLLAAPAPAQDPPIHSVELLEYPWPAGVGSGAFGRSVSGELTGDHLRDAVVLRGDSPCVMHAPQVFGVIEQLALEANDLEVLPAAGPGGRDALLTVGPNGLQRTHLDPANGAWKTALIGLAPYADGRALRVGDIDADGRAEVALLDAHGQNVHFLRGGGPGLVPFYSVSLAVPALDLELLDWEDDGQLELALLHAFGLSVIDRRGATLLALPAIQPGGALAVVHRPQGDRLAWVTTGPLPSGLQQVLRVVGADIQEPSIDLGDELGAVSLSTFDLEADGDEDLLIGHRHSLLEVLLLNREHGIGAGSATTFSVFDPWAGLIPVLSSGAESVPNPLNQARPVFLDFDGDGDADLLFPVESVPQATMVVNPLVDARAFQPKVIGAKAPVLPPIQEYGLILELAGPDALSSSGPPASSIPTPLGPGSVLVPPSVIAGGAEVPAPTHVQFLLWRQADLASPVGSVAVLNELHPLPESWPESFGLVLAETDPKFEAVYHFLIRIVAYEDQAIADAWPGIAGSLTASPSGLVEIELFGNGPTVVILPTDDPPPPTQTGGFVPRAHLPIFFQPPTAPPPTFVGSVIGG